MKTVAYNMHCKQCTGPLSRPLPCLLTAKRSHAHVPILCLVVILLVCVSTVSVSAFEADGFDIICRWALGCIAYGRYGLGSFACVLLLGWRALLTDTYLSCRTRYLSYMHADMPILSSVAYAFVAYVSCICLPHGSGLVVLPALLPYSAYRAWQVLHSVSSPCSYVISLTLHHQQCSW